MTVKELNEITERLLKEGCEDYEVVHDETRDILDNLEESDIFSEIRLIFGKWKTNNE